MPLSSLHKGTIVSAPSPLLFKALRVTCLCVVLGRYQQRSLTFFAFVQAYVAEVIRYSSEVKPAQYVKIEYGKDPLVYGMIDGDHHQYVKSFQATPFPSAGPLHTYTSSQLEFFEDDHNLRPEVDSAVHHLYNKSAMAEVECYWVNKKKLKQEYEELWQVQHDIWKRELTLGGCAQRLAGAQVYQRIEAVNRARLHILMDEYKAHRHGHRS